MYEIILLNEREEKFKKEFNSYYLYEKALKSYRRSNKLKILSYGKVGF